MTSYYRDLVEISQKFQRDMAKLVFDFGWAATRVTYEAKKSILDSFRGPPKDGWAAPQPQEPDQVPDSPALLLAGPKGEVARAAFAVSNSLPSALVCELQSTTLVSEDGTPVDAEFRFSPRRLRIGPGEQAVCAVEVTIDESFPPEVSFHAMISAGSDGTQIPVVVRRIVPPDS